MGGPAPISFPEDLEAVPLRRREDPYNDSAGARPAASGEHRDEAVRKGTGSRLTGAITPKGRSHDGGQILWITEI